MGDTLVMAVFRADVVGWGYRPVSKMLTATGRRALDASEAFQDVADYLMQVEELQFDTEGGLSGGWAPLDVSTLRRKRYEGKDDRILHASRRLRLSLTQRGDPDMILEITAHRLVFGSSVPYGGAHQHGAPGANIPARPPIEISRGRKTWITRLLKRGIVQRGGRF